MTHQAQSNESIQEQQFVVVSEIEAMTISGTPVQPQAFSTGTAPPASPNVVTYAPNAPPALDNGTMILPSGVPAPSFGGTESDQDPAIIIEEDQLVFVSFVQQQ